MTNKDLIFTITAIVWLSSNIVGYVIDANFGVAVSNIICIGLFGIMTIIKLNYKKFSFWLDRPIR